MCANFDRANAACRIIFLLVGTLVLGFLLKFGVVVFRMRLVQPGMPIISGLMF